MPKPASSCIEGGSYGRHGTRDTGAGGERRPATTLRGLA
jgi:hypothetical protein